MTDRRADPILVPHPERFASSDPGYTPAMVAHTTAVGRGEDGYIDPTTGFFVFTAAYLRDRGECCEVGCRHCPWIGSSTGDLDTS